MQNKDVENAVQTSVSVGILCHHSMQIKNKNIAILNIFKLKYATFTSYL